VAVVTVEVATVTAVASVMAAVMAAVPCAARRLVSRAAVEPCEPPEWGERLPPEWLLLEWPPPEWPPPEWPPLA